MSEDLSNRIQELENALAEARYWAEHAPRYYRNILVPDYLRANWTRPEAAYWRIGVESVIEHMARERA